MSLRRASRTIGWVVAGAVVALAAAPGAATTLGAATTRGAAATPGAAAAPGAATTPGDSAGATPPAHRLHFDHAIWARILATCVDDAGRVAYKRIAEEQDAALRSYLESVGRARPDDWPRDEQIAFWLNAYNAGIVSAVLDGQSAESLIGRARLFKSWKFAAAGRNRTPDEIEHKILRQRFEEPRIHFALVCASASCPPLRRNAYAADSLTLQLDDQARRFVSDPSRNLIDPAAQRLELSAIFDWFRTDFERASGTVQRYLARYVGDETTRQWLLSGAVPPKFRDYDWSLNQQTLQRPERRRPTGSR